MITYVKSVDAECLINSLIYSRRGTRVAPAEQDIVEARRGFDAGAGKGLTCLRKERSERQGKEEMKGALFKNRSAVLILPQLELMAKLL